MTKSTNGNVPVKCSLYHMDGFGHSHRFHQAAAGGIYRQHDVGMVSSQVESMTSYNEDEEFVYQRMCCMFSAVS